MPMIETRPFRKSPTFVAVDFFCGAGGTTRGLIDAGGYVIAGIDKDSRCKPTYIANNRNLTRDLAAPRFLHRDIFPIDPLYPNGQQQELFDDLDHLIAAAREAAPKTPLLFAICAPCQPFTKLSRTQLSASRTKTRDRDSHLLSEALKFVEHYSPELVLSENVQGINDPKYGGVWEEFRQTLETLGYATGSEIVCASAFGIPQYRKRSILIALRGSIARQDRLADGSPRRLTVPKGDPKTSVRTVRSAISHLPALEAGAADPHFPNHRARSLSQLNQKRMAAARPGASNACLDDTPDGDLSLACHRSVNAKLKTRCFNDVYTRMHPDRPSPTITTKCHSISNGRFGHYDVRQLRGISLREAAILQSFPQDYIFHPVGMIEPIARMIGNAVPPKLAEYFSRYLVESIAYD